MPSEHRPPVAWPHVIRAVAGVGLVACLVYLLLPVLKVPPIADATVHYLRFPSTQYADNVVQLTVAEFAEIPENARRGRLAPFGYLVQKYDYVAEPYFAKWTGLDFRYVHAGWKLAMLGLVWLFLAGVLATVRQQRGDTAEPLSRATRGLILLLFPVLLVTTTQTQGTERNSWVAYPHLIYPGVMWLFAGLALGWLAVRWYAAERRLLAVTVMVVWGAATALHYELYLASLPAVVVGLARQGVALPEARDRWRARLVPSVVVASSAAATLAVSRLYIASQADPSRYYEGTDPSFSFDLLTTLGDNVVNTVGFVSGDQAAQQLAARSMSAPSAFSGNAWWVALLACVAVGVISGPWVRAARERREGGALLSLVLVGLSAVFFSSLTMSVSRQAQELMTWGTPYRCTVINAAGLTLSVTAGLVVLVQRFPRGGEAAMLLSVSVALVAFGALLYPQNAAVSRSLPRHPNLYASTNLQVSLMNWDDSAAGDARRCELIEYVRTKVWKQRAPLLERSAWETAEFWYDAPFCSTAEPPSGLKRHEDSRGTI